MSECLCIKSISNRWVWNFFIKNYGKELKISDLESCPKYDKSGTIGQKLSKEWDKEIEKTKSGKNASLLAAIHRVFGLEYAIHGFILIFSQGVIPIFQTVVMGWLVQRLAEIDKNDGKTLQELDDMKFQTYMYGLYLVMLQAVYVLMVHPYYWSAFRIGMDVRIACCHLVYRKSLRLSKAALAQTTIGQIVNLMSNDVNRFDWLLIYPHFIVIGPLMTIATTLILYYLEEFGNECLPGIAILILYIPFQSVLGKVFTTLREKTASLTDERVRITNEFVKAIKVIKVSSYSS